VGEPSVNSGGGQWYAPSFDAQGDVYIGVANPAPLFGTKSYPLGSSRPGPDLYTDSVVKLSPHGKLLWYYQLTPHDLYDWDLQNNPVLTTANGRPVVDRRRQGGHLVRAGREDRPAAVEAPGGRAPGTRERRAAHRERQARLARRPAREVLPRAEHLRRHRDPAGQQRLHHVRRRQRPRAAGVQTGYTAGVAADLAAVAKATGEMVAVNQDTGTVEWDTPIPSSPYGAATVTNDVVFTTTFHGDLFALNAGTGQILLKTPLSAGSNAPVAVDGDYVIAGAGASLVPSQQRMIIAYKLGATGKLPDTVGS
jgi:Glucose dehydrogenase